jgi:LCP family protein required for cell wall assembly
VPKRFSKPLLLSIIFFAAIIVLVWGVKAFSRSSEGGLLKFLTPQKGKVLDTVMNLAFDTNKNFERLKGYNEDRINILLLGVGGPGHEGPNLTDTIVLASIKPSTKEVALVAIPRDLQVKSEHGYSKINAVNVYNLRDYKKDGLEHTRQFYEQQFGQSIPYYIQVNFKALKDAVDAVGGVVVNVPRKLEDYEYPNDIGEQDKRNGSICSGEDPSSPCRYLHIKFDVGVQELNGERALIYARSRHGTDGDDYGRSARQQLIMVALKDKVLSFGTFSNFSKVKDLYHSLSDNVATNLDLDDIMALGAFSKNIERSSIINLVLEDPGLQFLTDGSASMGLGAIKVPVTGNFEQINKAIAYIFDPTARAYLQKQKKFSTPTSTDSGAARVSNAATSSYKIELQNGTWQAGLAAQVKKGLDAKGFLVTSIANSVKRPIDKTTIYIVNSSMKSEYVAELKKAMNADVATTLPEWMVASSSTSNALSRADVVVVVGVDFKNN